MRFAPVTIGLILLSSLSVLAQSPTIRLAREGLFRARAWNARSTNSRYVRMGYTGAAEFVYASIGAALEDLPAKSTIYIEASGSGDAYEESFGSWTKPVPSHTRLIGLNRNFVRPVIRPPASETHNQVMAFNDRRNIHVENLVLDAVNVDSLHGVKIERSTQITISSCEIKNAPQNGIQVIHNASSCAFLNLNVHHCRYGIYVKGDNCKVVHCDVHHCDEFGIHVWPTDTGVAADAAADDYTYRPEGNSLLMNYLHDNRRGIIFGHGRNNLAQGNTIRGGIRGIEIAGSESDTTVVGNDIRRCFAGVLVGVTWSDNSTMHGILTASNFPSATGEDANEFDFYVAPDVSWFSNRLFR